MSKKMSRLTISVGFIMGLVTIFVAIAYCNNYILAIGSIFLMGCMLTTSEDEIKKYITRKQNKSKCTYYVYSTKQTHPVKLIDMDSAIAKELLTISKILSKMISQALPTIFSDVPRDFIAIYDFYKNYPFIAYTTDYMGNERGKEGLIIMFLANFDPSMQETPDVDSKIFRLMHTRQIAKIEVGMNLPIYIYAADLKKNYMEIKYAKIITITRFEIGYHVQLEFHIEEIIVTRTIDFDFWGHVEFIIPEI